MTPICEKQRSDIGPAQEALVSRGEMIARAERINIYLTGHPKLFSSDTLASVRSLDLTRESELIKAAQVLCLGSPYMARHIFKECDIQDQAVRVDIAKECVAATKTDDLHSIANSIREFGILDQAALTQIAEMINQRLSPSSIANYIRNFGVLDQEVLIKFAKRWAEAGLEPRDIRDFGIQDQSALIDIAMMFAKREIRGHAHTAAAIQEFGIKDQTALITIAKTIAERNPSELAYSIRKFGIQDQSALIDIARICLRKRDSGVLARVDASSALSCLGNFGILDDSALIEIIKEYIISHPPYDIRRPIQSVMREIQNFGFRSKTAVIDLIGICAALDSDGFVDDFQKLLGLRDQNDRIRIAKICVKHMKKERGSIKKILNFGIDDPSALTEIIKIYAVEDSRSVIQYIKIFGIQDQKALADIYLHCSMNDAHSLRDLGSEKFSSIFSYDPNWNQLDAEATLGDYIRERLPGSGFEWVLPYLAAIQDPHARKTVLISIAAALFFLRNRLTNDQLKIANLRQWFQSVYEMRSPHLYLPFIEHIAQFLEKESAVRTASKVLPLDLEEYRPFLKLLRVMIAQLLDQGVHAEPLAALLDGSHHKTFKDLKKSKLLLNVLRNLVESPLTSQVKTATVRKLIAAPYESAVALSIIFDLDKSLLLQDTSTSLDVLSHQAVLAVVPFSYIENFSLRFAETFGQSRASAALWQYAASHHQDPVMMKAIAAYAQSVLMGTYFEERYQTVHMREIAPELVALWRKGLVMNEIQGDSEYEFVHPLKWMQEKILSHGHMKDHLPHFPHLEAYLHSQTNAVEKIKPFEEACFLFGDSWTHKSQETALLAMLKALKDERIECEFANDIEGFLRNIQESKLRPDLRGIDTDDPYHFLLCGTEVSGSCQRVGGDPRLNLCLMGYPGHGHNRLLAIVDSNDRIQARTILRIPLDQDNKPVLFVEPMYGDPRLESALMELAKMKARQMGLPLTACHIGAENFSGGDLRFLGGPMPYEYCDALRGIQPNGIFAISHARIV